MAQSEVLAGVSVAERANYRELRSVRIREQLYFFLLALPAILLLVFLFLYPLVSFLSQSLFDPSFTAEHYARALTGAAWRKIFRNTFEISFFTTLGCLLLGYPVAYVLANISDRVRNLALPLVIIPFWTSVLVRAYAWIAILGREGVLNVVLRDLGLIASPLALLYNRPGVYVGMVHYLLPFMVFANYAVMRGIPEDLLRAAESLGASPFQGFLRVYFPLSLPGVAAGSLLVFILALGFFITPALLGGPKEIMLSMVIEQQISQTFNWGFAGALSVILLILTIVFYLVYSRFMSFERLYGGESR